MRQHFIATSLCGLVALTLFGCGSATTGSQSGTGGNGSGGASSGGSGGAGGSTAAYTVALMQAQKAQASDLTMTDVVELVQGAVSQAGGLDFIHDGQTVVLKPNLPSLYQDAGLTDASLTASGTATDWRLVKAVADLVRAKNPTGTILVMEGSRMLTSLVFTVLGYTAENFGSSVDEFVTLEGDSCADTSTTALEQRAAPSGKTYWLNKRYVTADVVISMPNLETDAAAGIGGAVVNLGLGATPAGKYGSGTNSIDCTRTMIDQSTPEVVGDFVRDYFALRPADFVVMDGLQGLEHGPLPAWDDSGSYEYDASIKNLRVVLAGKNAIAVDTVAALVMKCDPKKVPFLTKLAADGLGPTDATKIAVAGKPASDVAKAFASKQTQICPGQ